MRSYFPEVWRHPDTDATAVFIGNDAFLVTDAEPQTAVYLGRAATCLHVQMEWLPMSMDALPAAVQATIRQLVSPYAPAPAVLDSGAETYRAFEWWTS